MNIKIFFALLVPFLLGAVEIPLNGTFERLNSAGMPSGWLKNAWEGYRPYADWTLQKGEAGAPNSLKLSNVTSDRGAAFGSDFYPARCGDQIRYAFQARGKGKAKLQMYFQTTAGEWNFMSPKEYTFLVGDEWRDFSATLPVLNGAAGETGAFDLCFEIEKGGELEVRALVADRVEGLYRGDVAFPERWIVFPNVAKDYVPTAEELTSGIPETLDGVSGKVVSLQDHAIDLKRIQGAGEGKCAWAFAEIQSKVDCDYTVGAGADWWMLYHLNGEVIFDTIEVGNVEYPFDMANHVATARLHAGRNVVAVKVVTGKADGCLWMGGPLELANRSKPIRLSKLEWIEDFDAKTVKCGGVPDLIEGYPAPGLLSPTGQGVFRTADALELLPADVASSAFPSMEAGKSRAVGVRIQNFGRSENAASALEFRLKNDGNGRDFRVTVENPAADAEPLRIRVFDNGACVGEDELSRASLPAELLVALNARGDWAFKATSLADGSAKDFGGTLENYVAASGQPLELGVAFRTANAGESAELVADNLQVGQAAEESAEEGIPPFLLTPDPAFDPVKAGWKLVFEDDFDGDELDLDKWQYYYTGNQAKDLVKVHDGIVQISGDWNAEHDAITRLGKISTKQSFLYGYFEARCRFKTKAGWWTAFWLYADSVRNPFYDGFEIDIYEDYYLQPTEAGATAREVLDHNLHLQNGSVLKSWNYSSPRLPNLDDFYVIGCKWTPFEISYYLNGKLISATANHSPYNSVTFDAFHHGTGIAPLYAILSAQPTKSFTGKPKEGDFPDSFLTDYVRIYEYPHDKDPAIRWTKTPDPERVPHVGDTLEFSVEVAPSEVTGSPAKDVYLFDSGYLIEHKSEPPYDFKVLMTKEFFDTTNFAKGGRQKIPLDFQKNSHVFSVFVQDEAGEVAHTDGVPFFFVAGRAKSTPYGGKPQVVPGRIRLPYYDEGGNGVAYRDATKGNENARKGSTFRSDEDVDCTADSIGYVLSGEWLNYTVDIREAREYRATLRYGTQFENKNEYALLYLDDKLVGRLPVPKTPNNWATDTDTSATVTLPAGVHTLTVLFTNGINASHLDLE